MNELMLQLLPDQFYEMQDEPIDMQLWWTNAPLMALVVLGRGLWITSFTEWMLYTLVCSVFLFLAYVSATR